jgi:hypothetical protein
MATTSFYYSVVFYAVPKYIYTIIIDELYNVGGAGQFYVYAVRTPAGKQPMNGGGLKI